MVECSLYVSKKFRVWRWKFGMWNYDTGGFTMFRLIFGLVMIRKICKKCRIQWIFLRSNSAKLLVDQIFYILHPWFIVHQNTRSDRCVHINKNSKRHIPWILLKSVIK